MAKLKTSKIYINEEFKATVDMHCYTLFRKRKNEKKELKSSKSSWKVVGYFGKLEDMTFRLLNIFMLEKIFERDVYTMNELNEVIKEAEREVKALFKS